jgi:hypothetical protein
MNNVHLLLNRHIRDREMDCKIEWNIQVKEHKNEIPKNLVARFL